VRPDSPAAVPTVPSPLPSPALKALLSRKEACYELCCSIGTLEKVIKQGDLDILRIGRRVLVKRASLERLMKKRAISTRPPASPPPAGGSGPAGAAPPNGSGGSDAHRTKKAPARARLERRPAGAKTERSVA
jgi:excisionase family DNA binding protein